MRQFEPSSEINRVAVPYSFSFISGALYLPESVAVAELMLEEGDWKSVVRKVSEHNVLRQRTDASRTRLLREIRYRLQQFSTAELEFFCKSNSRDQRHLLFIAICQHFRFIREFIDEVLRAKLLTLDTQFYPSDFSRFFDDKSTQAEEVERLSDKSRAKIKQVIIRMLSEVGLLDSTSSQRIQRVVPGRDLVHLIAKIDPKRLRFLLLSDADICQMKN